MLRAVTPRLSQYHRSLTVLRYQHTYKPMDKPSQVGNFKKDFGPVNLSALYTPEAKAIDDANLMTLTRWQSQKSGLRVGHLDVPGPLCDLYATVATEIQDDTGRPHTLEHLIFLGSESYPYKGVLDQLANRSLGIGTNAWTAVRLL